MPYWITSSNFIPFNETQLVLERNYATGSIETRLYASGKDLKTFNSLTKGTNVKIWGGSVERTGQLNHSQKISSFGDPDDSTIFFNNSQFQEKEKFIVQNTLNPNYVTNIIPISLNNGPQNDTDSCIKIFKDRLFGRNNDPFLEENKEIKLQYSFERISSSFIPFLETQNLFGNTNSGSIKIPNQISDIEENIAAFSEDNIFVINNLNQSKLNIINSLEEQDIKNKSSGFGFTNGYTNKYGRDSITYAGYFRGSN